MNGAESAGRVILVVEDDLDLAREIADTLSDYGMRPVVATTWDAALAELAAGKPDLVLLDQRLGTVDTVPLLPRLRALTAAPVLFLTGNRAEADRIVALEIGADDFLLKPTSGRELVARIRAHLRRAGAAPEAATPAEWRLNIGERRLTRPDGSEVPLTAAEFDLVAVLAEHAGRALDRDELTQRVLGRPWRPDDRALDNLVLHVRQKLGPGCERTIATVRNRGYVFTAFPKA
ncbi:response regulator transcription factor [Roseomonas sp. PWR1]|uniref:Response regulator transcription factor n=1 Tax=Roseomonas nitratireducens TaxID=2820810 RepID=A0ABS4AS89_9PROT|nr:response regulator transcription factor [Neoroseomonas nitratireducens]MBP0464220.1 response regulator transcription factor [Neoroseomonas nitratireducens]